MGKVSSAYRCVFNRVFGPCSTKSYVGDFEDLWHNGHESNT